MYNDWFSGDRWRAWPGTDKEKRTDRGNVLVSELLSVRSGTAAAAAAATLAAAPQPTAVPAVPAHKSSKHQ